MLNHRNIAKFFLLPGLVTLFALPGFAADSAAVAAGKEVSFSYTLSADGEVIESSDAANPVVYLQGAGQVLPGLEAELVGMKAGEKKTVKLAAADAYGDVRADAIQEVPAAQIPEDARVEGAMLQAQGYPGPIRVTSVTDETVTLDFNHPLAGKDLTFDIAIIAVNDAPPAPAPAALPEAPPPAALPEAAAPAAD